MTLSESSPEPRPGTTGPDLVGGPAGFGAFARALPGTGISHIWRGYDADPVLYIEFGMLSPRVVKYGAPGNPQGEWTLQIERSWSVSGRRLQWNSDAHSEVGWRRVFRHLYRRQVTSVSLRGSLPEIELCFDNGLRLISISTADGSPSWTLTKRIGGKTASASVRDGQWILP